MSLCGAYGRLSVCIALAEIFIELCRYRAGFRMHASCTGLPLQVPRGKVRAYARPWRNRFCTIGYRVLTCGIFNREFVGINAMLWLKKAMLQ